jgi:hypothetical protein
MGSEEPSLGEIADTRRACMSAPPGECLTIVLHFPRLMVEDEGKEALEST